METFVAKWQGGAILMGLVPLALALTGLSGCGGSALPVRIHPVSSEVFLAKGVPLGSGTIHFQPVSDPGLKAGGKFQTNGTFTLLID